MRAWAKAAFLVALFSVCAASAQPDDRVGQFASAFETIRREHAIPALAAGVVDDGAVVFARVFGADQAARFRAASVSKLLTAQAVMQLAEQGKLSLDDDVGRYAPDFAGRGITIRHLLTHRSGIADAVSVTQADDAVRIEAYLAVLAAADPTATPGAQWAYSDAEFNVLGAVISSASGEAYADYVTRSVLAPVGASGASLFPGPAERAGVLSPSFNYGFAFPAPSRPYDIAFAPSEGLVTDIGSLTAWLAATLSEDPRLMTAASYEAMLTPQAPADGDWSAGLGWQLHEEDGRRLAQHGGSFKGWNALVLTYPEEQRGFVILTNADEAPRWDIARVADAILDGRPYEAPSSSRVAFLAFYAGLAAGVVLLIALLVWRRRVRRPA